MINNLFTPWQTVFVVPPQNAPDPIQKETAESLLRKLIERNDPAHVSAQFILAVMLERKRLLKVRDQLWQEQRRLFVYEHARSGELFQIIDPGLRLDQLEEVQRDVARLLEEGLPAPGGPPLPMGNVNSVTSALAEPASVISEGPEPSPTTGN